MAKTKKLLAGSISDPALEQECIEALEWADRLGFWLPLPMTAPWIDRDVWLPERMTGIGSSDVALLMSEDPDDRDKLWLQKTGQWEDDLVDSWDLRRGRVLEEIAAAEYERATGRQTIRLPLARHVEAPWLLTDVDRLILPGTGYGAWRTEEARALEIKVVRWHVLKRYRNEGVADRIIWQMAHHSLVTGLPTTGWIFNADSGVGEPLDFDRRPDLEEAIAEEAARFWHDHVEKRVRPPRDSLPVEGIAVEAEDGGDQILHVEQDWIDAASAYIEAEPLYRAAETAKKEAVDRLRALAGGRIGRHVGAGVSATLSERAGSTKWKETVDAIADAWPIDREKLRARWLSGDVLIRLHRDQEPRPPTEEEVSNLLNDLNLSVYDFKVVGKGSTAFTPRVLREED